MFVALRDLRFAWGRFVLMAGVILLISYLVVFLASLTQGLADESTSAVTELPADHLAFTVAADAEPAGPGGGPTFTGSQVTEDQWKAWGQVDGVRSAEPVGIATARSTSPSTTAAVTAFGLRPGSDLLPGGTDQDIASGTVLLSRGAAEDLDAKVGDTIATGALDLKVAAVLDSDASYAHTPVIWVDLDDWQGLGAHLAPGATASTVATVVALTTDGDVDLDAADEKIGTVTESRRAAKSAISSYASEHGSLLLMEVFLVGISALVVGAFFTVWTISRSTDIAVLKALGASTLYLLRDAVGQAIVILLVGVGLGAVFAAVTAQLLHDIVPVVVSPGTALLPAVVLMLLGILGAGLAIGQITRVDPHAALAAR